MSTPDLRSAANRVDRRSRRSRQRKLGASEIGDCRRLAGYRFHGTKPTNESDNIKAVLGTWLHKGALSVLRKEFGAFIEVMAEDEHLRGHIDAVYLDEEAALRLSGSRRVAHPADVITVEDVKSKSVYAMDSVRTRGPKRKEKYQVHLYADLLRRGLAAPGRGDQAAIHALGPLDVQKVRLRYVCRDNGDEFVWESDFDEQVLMDARFWRDEVLESESPEELPRDQDGPGLSFICDSCPFLDECWGPEREDGKPRQVILVHNDEEVAQALRDYDEARLIAADAEKAKKKARAMLSAAPPGRYGDLVLSWSEPRKEPDPVPDVEQMVKLFEAAGLEVPTIQPEKRSATIGVTRPKG